MDGITANDLLGAVVVVLACCGAIATVGKAVDTFRAWRKPQSDLAARVTGHDAQFAALERQLKKHEADIEKLTEGQRNMCAGVLALLEHELHNGNADQMIKASQDINEWLIKR